MLPPPRRSLSCRYAHSQTELRTQPNLQKTKLCKIYIYIYI